MGWSLADSLRARLDVPEVSLRSCPPNRQLLAVAGLASLLIPGIAFPQADRSCASRIASLFDRPIASLATRPYPDRILSGDFDGDGRPDLAVASRGYEPSPYVSGGVSFHFGEGDGTFMKIDIDQPPFMWNFQVLDWNGDGAQDIVYTNRSPGETMGIGCPGNRNPKILFRIDRLYQALASEDVDKNGTRDHFAADGADIWVLSPGSDPAPDSLIATAPSDVSMLAFGRYDDDDLPDLFVLTTRPFVARNLGGGRFGSLEKLDDRWASSMVVSDLDGDGRDDIALSTSYPDGILVHVSSTAGFRSLGLNQWSGPIAVADVTGDAVPDIVYANGTRLVRGRGNGGFEAPESVLLGPGLQSVAAADFDSDGIADIAGLSPYSRIFVRHGQSERFGLPDLVQTASPVLDARVSDLTRDGIPDLLVLGYQAIQLFTGVGSGRFDSGHPVLTGAGLVHFETADLDRDGHPDIIALDGASRTLTCWISDPSGGWADSSSSAVDVGANDFAVGDLNADGWPDAVVSCYGPVDYEGRSTGPGSILIFWNDGSGHFGTANAIDQARHCLDVTVTDFDDDGHPDVVAHDGSLVLFHGGSGGQFSPGRSLSDIQCLGKPLFVDINADGIEDLATGRVGVDVRLGLGEGQYAPPVNHSTGFWPRGPGAADLDGDGHTDLVTYSPDIGDLTLLLGDGSGRFPCSHAFGAGGQPNFISIADVDLDGRPDILTAAGTAVQIWYNSHRGASTPVRLESFTGSTSGNSIELLWRISGDSPVRFNVKRADGPDAEWTLVGTVDGKGPDHVFVDRGLTRAGTYRYLLEEIGRDGTLSRVGETAVQFTPTIAEPRASAWPNPFRSTLHLSYGLAVPSPVHLEVFDVAGRLIQRQEANPAGDTGEIVWNGLTSGGTPARPGTYFIRLEGPPGREQVFRVVRLR